MTGDYDREALKQARRKLGLGPPVDRPELDALLAAARGHVMTPEEQRAQRISWVYGNCSLDNPRITREMAEKAVDDMYGRPTVVTDPELAAIRAELQRANDALERAAVALALLASQSPQDKPEGKADYTAANILTGIGARAVTGILHVEGE